MGQYHDVVLAVTKDANIKLLDTLKSESIEINELFADNVSYRYTDKDKSVLYHWEWYKWDEDERNFLIKFLNSFNNDKSFRFIRLCEDNNIEYWGDLKEPFDPRIDSKIVYHKPNP